MNLVEHPSSRTSILRSLKKGADKMEETRRLFNGWNLFKRKKKGRKKLPNIHGSRTEDARNAAGVEEEKKIIATERQTMPDMRRSRTTNNH